MTEYRVRRAAGGDDLDAVRGLFQAYAASLPIDLGYQNFAAELDGLPGLYATPGGALFLARGEDGVPLGCAALRSLDAEGCCEMKRLYLDPAARGLGLGRALTAAVIGEARRLGHRELRLDTLPSMDAAQKLYAELGFRRIAPYYAPTPAGTVFMALTL